MKKKYYQPPNLDLWMGRADSSTPERWHQAMQLLPLDAEEFLPEAGFALLGFACDEGVRRNKGRTGAAEAPATIRKALGSMAITTPTPLFDAGDVVCPGEKLAKALERYRENNPLVLAIPRGGVEVGIQISKILSLEFSINTSNWYW